MAAGDGEGAGGSAPGCALTPAGSGRQGTGRERAGNGQQQAGPAAAGRGRARAGRVWQRCLHPGDRRAVSSGEHLLLEAWEKGKFCPAPPGKEPQILCPCVCVCVPPSSFTAVPPGWGGLGRDGVSPPRRVLQAVVWLLGGTGRRLEKRRR